MIIFDLDGTLSDPSHRQHFVDPSKNPDYSFQDVETKWGTKKLWVHNKTERTFVPDWKAFYEACDKDEPINPVIEIFQRLCFENPINLGREIQIWSGRCESVREKTKRWLESNVWGSRSFTLKMRPIGDSTPDDELKMKWLDEHIAGGGAPISFVFDDRPKMIRAWRRRGIFVFNCAQHEEEF